jgi:hypothetical protein
MIILNGKPKWSKYLICMNTLLKKAKLAAIELKGYAITWWNQIRTEYHRVGHDHITWEDLKREIRHHFVPAYYSRDLYLKLKRLVQGTRSVDEYFQELEMCLLRTGITEDNGSISGGPQ